MNLIVDAVTTTVEGVTRAGDIPPGKQLIPLEPFEWVYVQAQIKPWIHANGAARYILCAADEHPVLSLVAGYHLRLRSEAELAADPEHPIYQIAWLHITITDADGDDPPGVQNNGTDSFTMHFALRAGQAADSAIMTQVTATWRITIRKVVSEYDQLVIDTDVRRLPLVNGERTFDFTSTEVGTYRIDAQDFGTFEAVGVVYQLKLAQPVVFKVWR